MVLVPRTADELALFVAAPLVAAASSAALSPRRRYGVYHVAHGCWGVWCLAKGVGFYRRFGWAPFDLDRMRAIDPSVPRRWLREFGLYLVSELCWAAAIRDWAMFRHHVPLLLFYRFAQDHAVTQPMLISVVEAVNIPVGLEGLMRWWPAALYSTRRAIWLRWLKVAIVLARMLLNCKMLSMVVGRGGGTGRGRGGTSSEERGGAGSARVATVARAVQLFSLVWLLLDLNLLRQLLPIKR
jgi:hypothetical protein